MNYMKQVAEMLGVELGEKFKVRPTDGCKPDRATYMIDEIGVKYTGNTGRPMYRDDTTLDRLLNGSDEIVKLPWKPKDGEGYFYINKLGVAGHMTFSGSSVDIALYAFGNCFRTREEAEAHKDEILQKMNEVLNG